MTDIPTEEDLSLLLKAQCHLGAEKMVQKMSPYVFKKSTEGSTHVINLLKTWEKIRAAARMLVTIQNPKDICLVSSTQWGKRSIFKFSQYTDASFVSGRFTPGTFTNQICKSYKEPLVLIVTDPALDYQPIREASYVNVPVIACCDTDSPTDFVDIMIPCNNKSKLSVSAVMFLLCRELLKMRGKITKDNPWNAVVDLFIYKDADQLEKMMQNDIAAEENERRKKKMEEEKRRLEEKAKEQQLEGARREEFGERYEEEYEDEDAPAQYEEEMEHPQEYGEEQAHEGDLYEMQDPNEAYQDEEAGAYQQESGYEQAYDQYQQQTHPSYGRQTQHTMPRDAKEMPSQPQRFPQYVRDEGNFPAIGAYIKERQNKKNLGYAVDPSSSQFPQQFSSVRHSASEHQNFPPIQNVGAVSRQANVMSGYSSSAQQMGQYYPQFEHAYSSDQSRAFAGRSRTSFGAAQQYPQQYGLGYQSAQQLQQPRQRPQPVFQDFGMQQQYGQQSGYQQPPSRQQVRPGFAPGPIGQQRAYMQQMQQPHPGSSQGAQRGQSTTSQQTNPAQRRDAGRGQQ